MTDEYPDAVDAIWFAFAEESRINVSEKVEANIREKVRMVIDEERKRAITAAYAVHTAIVESSYSTGLFQQQSPSWINGPMPSGDWLKGIQEKADEHIAQKGNPPTDSAHT